MFNTISLAGTGWLVALIGWIVGVAGLDPVIYDGETIRATADGIIIVVGFVLALIGQWRRKDLQYGVIRK